MTRSRARDPTPREHPLTEAVRLLAAEVRMLREAVDELATEIQWQNQNRSDPSGERGGPFTVPDRERPVTPVDAIETSSSAPSPPRRLDGRLF